METMRAVQVSRFGGPETMAIRQVPKPRPGPGELLVRVEASAINPIDWKLREGLFKDLPLPFTPGGDFCGTVEGLGDGARDFRNGDVVYGVGRGSVGADAEFLAVPSANVALKPRKLDPTEAATVPLAGMTAYQGLFTHGRLERGRTVLILGASGGVGSFAVQLAKLAGATVIGTASTENVERVRALGADRVIDYKKEKVERSAQGVDLCLDLVGGEFQKRAFDCIKRGGRLISTVQPPDEASARKAGVEGAFFIMRPDGSQLRELAAKIDAGQLQVEVARVLPFEKAAEAEELNRKQEVTGKIVLQIH